MLPREVELVLKCAGLAGGEVFFYTALYKNLYLFYSKLSVFTYQILCPDFYLVNGYQR